MRKIESSMIYFKDPVEGNNEGEQKSDRQVVTHTNESSLA